MNAAAISLAGAVKLAATATWVWPASAGLAAAANRPLFYGSHGPLTNHEAMARITHFVNRHLTDFAGLGKEEPSVSTDRMKVADPNVG